MKDFRRQLVALSVFTLLIFLAGTGCSPIMNPVGSEIVAEDIAIESTGDSEAGEEDPGVDEFAEPVRDSVDNVPDPITPDYDVLPPASPVTLFAMQVNSTGGQMMWQTVVYTLYQSDPVKRCYLREVGSCTISDCRSSRYGPEPPSWISAGPVTFTTPGLSDVVMEPDDQGVYLTHKSAGTRWSPGDMITISAPGDELPAFEVEAVMPTPLNTLEPDMASAVYTIQISRSEALVMTWEPTDAEVSIELAESQSGTGTETMQDFIDVGCRFEGSSGAGEIPLEVMSELEGGQPVSFVCLEHVDRHEMPLGDRTLMAGAGHIVCRDAVIE